MSNKTPMEKDKDERSKDDNSDFGKKVDKSNFEASLTFTSFSIDLTQSLKELLAAAETSDKPCLDYIVGIRIGCDNENSKISFYSFVSVTDDLELVFKNILKKAKVKLRDMETSAIIYPDYLSIYDKDSKLCIATNKGIKPNFFIAVGKKLTPTENYNNTGYGWQKMLTRVKM